MTLSQTVIANFHGSNALFFVAPFTGEMMVTVSDFTIDRQSRTFTVAHLAKLILSHKRMMNRIAA